MANIDDPNGIIIPDVPQTALAFRTWRLSESGKLLSINAPSLTGKAGGSGNQPRRISWIHKAMADEGQDGWPIGDPLVAHCGIQGANAEKIPEHGKIPSKNCSCGIYATTSIKVINQYLGNEVIMGTIAIRGPVLGIVEMGGSVRKATQGFRAAYARVAAILKIDPAFSLAEGQLKVIAEFYKVPLITPHSIDPADYRDDIEEMPAITGNTNLGDEAEQFLMSLETEDDDDEGGE